MDIHARIAAIGSANDGVWSRAQALEVGFASATIDHLVARGIWRRWFDGPVFGPAGTPPRWETRLSAAALRLAPYEGVVARRTAARLWGLPGFGENDALEFVTTHDHTPRVRGLTVVRTILLPASDVVTFGGRPTTSVTRTIHDLARVERSDERLLVAAAEGFRLGRTDPWRLLGSLHARPGLAGNARLRRVIERLDPRLARARSVAEVFGGVRLVELGYEDFEVNVRLDLSSGRGVEVDVLFRGRRVLEINGARYHGTVLQRAADAERRADLEADGYRVAELWADELHDRDRIRTVVDDLIRGNDSGRGNSRPAR